MWCVYMPQHICGDYGTIMELFLSPSAFTWVPWSKLRLLGLRSICSYLLKHLISTSD